jgi:hypothetical protein
VFEQVVHDRDRKAQEPALRLDGLLSVLGEVNYLGDVRTA